MKSNRVFWKKCPSVTSGGKNYFWIAYDNPEFKGICSGGRKLGCVVWNRIRLKYNVQDEKDNSLGFVDTVPAGKKMLEKSILF